MNAADDPATARIRNLGAQLDAASANRKLRVWHDIVAPGVTAVLVLASLVMIGYVIAIANDSADSQDVSSCRAEFNARMQAASVVLISETVSAALAGTTDDPATIARLSDLSDAATARTAQVAAATGAVTDRAVAGFDISLLRMLARRTAVRGSRFAGVPISGPGIDAAWLVDDGVRASASAFEGVEGFLRKAFGWSLLLVSGECGLRWLADFGLAENAERAAVLDSDRWAVTLGAGPELLAWLHLAAPVLDKPEPWRWTPPPSTALRSQNIEDALLGG